jgi:hypothetical protein
VRLKIAETPEFSEALLKEPPARVPIARLFATHGGTVVAGSAGVIAGFALVYIAGPFALAQATGPLGYARTSFLLVQLAGLLCTIPVLALFATLSDRSNVSKYLAIGSVATILAGMILGPGLASGSLLIACATLIFLDCCWACTASTLSAWLCRLYPCSVRYSGFAFAFNTGGIVGGAVIPIIAQMMSGAGGLQYAGLLLSAAGLLTFFAAILSHPQPRLSVTAAPAPVLR